jgi:endonuclease YncB( thermonuclease family)
MQLHNLFCHNFLLVLRGLVKSHFFLTIAPAKKDMSMWLFIILLTLIPYACLGQGWEGNVQTWKGKVIEVKDGDTYKVTKPSGKTADVRLYGIDCPEHDQRYGSAATKQVSDRILNDLVKVKKVETGRHGKVIGVVYSDGDIINAWLIGKGLAWVYDRYCNNKTVCDILRDHQQKARSANAGLWLQSDPVPPWEYR